MSMGMFDYVTCKYPLPQPGMNEKVFQSKDTPAQWCDSYEIREDGTLWHKAYDVEDHSDPSRGGLMGLAGCLTCVNERWEPLTGFTGEIEFHGFVRDDEGWVSYSSYFRQGILKELHTLEFREGSA